MERYLDTLIRDKSAEKTRLAYADQAGEMLDYMDELGRVNFSHVRPPVPEFALINGTLMLRRPEVANLLGLLFEETAAAIGTALKLGIRWAWDVTRFPRGTRLVPACTTCYSNALAKYGALH